MATGSRASVPKNVPTLPGIFTMRSRNDADNFKKHIPKNGHVLLWVVVCWVWKWRLRYAKLA
jgi:ferredoxin-nitrate reductase